MNIENTANTVTIGGERYRGQDSYMQNIVNLFSRISNLSSGNSDYENMLWELDYLTGCLISMIINPTDRDEFAQAKEDILCIEYMKRVPDPTKYENADQLKEAIPNKKDVTRAGIAANMAIFGEIVYYMDRFFGFEQKLEVLQK